MLMLSPCVFLWYVSVSNVDALSLCVSMATGYSALAVILRTAEKTVWTNEFDCK